MSYISAIAALATAASLTIAPDSIKKQPPIPAVVNLTHNIPKMMRQAEIPGLAIALLRNGHTDWVHDFGTVNPATNQPVTDRTRFSIASLSKTVFSYVVLQLAEQGKIDLDTPLSHYWPERIVDPANDPQLDKITARIVLNHSTGFPDWRTKGGPLRIYFTPGSRFSYSGEGYVYLQHTVEHIEGKPLSEIAQELVFTPLGMKDSTYISGPGPEVTDGHDPAGRPIPPHTNKGNAAYSLLTTAHDYAFFLEAILNQHGMKPDSFLDMEKAQIAVDPSCTYCTDRAPVKLSTSLFWGLGWGIEQTASGKYLWHWGDNYGYKAFVAVNLNTRDAVVYFANSENGLAIGPELVREAIGGDHPAFPWLGYDTLGSPGLHFTEEVVRHGAGALETCRKDLIGNGISQQTIDTASRFLRDAKRFSDAIAIVKRYAELHSQSPDAWQSLGEAYEAAGQRESAAQSYKMALKVDPASEEARIALARLGSGPEAISQ